MTTIAFITLDLYILIPTWKNTSSVTPWAGLFESRLTLTQGLMLTEALRFLI